MNVLLTVINHVKSLLTPTYEINSTARYDSIKLYPQTSNGGVVTLSAYYFKRSQTVEVHLQGACTRNNNVKLVDIGVHELHNLTEHISYAMLPYIINANIQLDGVEQQRTHDIIKVMVSKLQEHGKEFKFIGHTSTKVDVIVKDNPNKLELIVTDGFYIQTENRSYQPLNENQLLGIAQ